MKKLFTILFFVVITANAFSQQNCQAYFTSSFQPAYDTLIMYDTLNLIDNSYNTDSTQINVTSWTWTVQYGGASYTYSTQNPAIPINPYPPSGSAYVCLQITTPTCQSTYCDTVHLIAPPIDTCIAAFTYQPDSVLNYFHFYDNSYTNNGTINSWSWVVYTSYNAVLFTSNLQNPLFMFPGNGTYRVCLTINSDSGCHTGICNYFNIQDPSNPSCQAYFTSSYNPVGNILNLYNYSYNTDSTQIMDTAWIWTVQYGGTSYTYTDENPVIQLNSYVPQVFVCLQVLTPTCQSTYCDTVYLNSVPADTCIAAYTYQADSVPNYFHFYDNSYTNNGTINSWSWVVTASDSTVLFTSNLQNPSFLFPGNGAYEICLIIYSDSGCQTGICNIFYIQDSINPNCQLNVSANISHVTVPGGNDGFIELTVTGGTPPYNYDWLNINLYTQNIYNLTSGIYMVNITSADPSCPAVTFTAQILEPYDSSNYVVDTLYTNIIDTCFGYVVDSFYIDSIFISGNNLVTVVWAFSGGGMNSTLYATYTYDLIGSQIVVLTINCDSAKNLATYSGYIYIGPTTGVNAENQQPAMLMYPNPVTDVLNIDFGQPLSGENSLQIYAASGQLVYNGSLTAGSANFRIDVGFLKKGIYFVKYEDGSGKYVTSKFLK